jgi:hypothetical protein
MRGQIPNLDVPKYRHLPELWHYWGSLVVDNPSRDTVHLVRLFMWRRAKRLGLR